MKFLSGSAVVFLTIASLFSSSIAAIHPSAEEVQEAESPADGQDFDGAGAVYMINNNVYQNSVIIFKAAKDGTVSFSGSALTGGIGMHGSDFIPIFTDALFSQGSVMVDQNFLFVVNAGSNTISMFSINPKNPTEIKLLGDPISSVGHFPSSIAINPRDGRVCVLNAGAINGVMCYTPDNTQGLIKFGDFHDLGADLLTPPTGPPGALSQILFSDDGRKMYVTAKGKREPLPYFEGYVATWDVNEDGTIDGNFTKTFPPVQAGALRPFGAAPIPGTHAIVASDPEIGATIYDFTNGNNGTVVPINIIGQASNCWANYANSTNTYFMSDFPISVIWEVKVEDNRKDWSIVNSYTLKNYSTPIDMAVGAIGTQEYLYINSANNTNVDVIKILPNGTSKQIQSYNFEMFNTKNFTIDKYFLDGMAAYMI